MRASFRLCPDGFDTGTGRSEFLVNLIDVLPDVFEVYYICLSFADCFELFAVNIHCTKRLFKRSLPGEFFIAAIGNAGGNFLFKACKFTVQPYIKQQRSP